MHLGIHPRNMRLAEGIQWGEQWKQDHLPQYLCARTNTGEIELIFHITS